MKEWITYKLKDICLKITDGSHFSPTAREDGYPMFSVKDMEEYGFNYDSCKRISIEDFNTLKANDCVPQKGDILVAKDGSFLKQIFVCNETREEAILSSIAIFRPNPEYVIPEFLCYILKSPKVYNYIAQNCVSGSALPRIVLKAFKEVEVSIPSIAIQKWIMSKLTPIDQKIQLNRQINDNLEQQAEALYKSWFIDFEPFCEEEFIESSLGSIPTGWKVGELNDVCEIVGGGTPSKNHPEYYCERGIAWLTPKDLSVSKSKFSSRGSEDITPEGYKNSSTKLMPRGTVLFSSRAPIGYISIATNEICTNQGFKSAIPGIAGTGYLYYFLKANTDKIESKASGSTFKEASGALMKSLEIIIPADGILNQFEAELAPILNKQENIASEIQALTTLRDTLLPKLMSGELKINEIDC